ncbi:hypothetical protein AB0C34_30355 [Nocardia sp. NPDC049220]|uniref:hypothetical protein n=1 Tax=Nocardia sp. NPDC049220 TaxID=3155273 RepID=UPI0033E09A4D
MAHSQAAYAAAGKTIPAPVILDTVADLAALVTALPPKLPLVLDDFVRIAPDATGDDDEIWAVVAEVTDRVYLLDAPVRDDVMEPALQLGVRVLASATSPAPPPGILCQRYDRMAEAFDHGNIGEYLTLLSRHLTRISVDLECPEQWVADGQPIPPELRDNAYQLRGIAAALADHAAAIELPIQD